VLRFAAKVLNMLHFGRKNVLKVLRFHLTLPIRLTIYSHPAERIVIASNFITLHSISFYFRQCTNLSFSSEKRLFIAISIDSFQSLMELRFK